MNVVKFTEQIVQRQIYCLCSVIKMSTLHLLMLFSPLLTHHTVHQQYLTKSGAFKSDIGTLLFLVCIVMKF